MTEKSKNLIHKAAIWGCLVFIANVFFGIAATVLAYKSTPVTTQVSAGFISTHQLVLHIALFSVLWAIIRGNLNTFAFAGACLLGTITNNTGIIDSTLHYWLVSVSFFPDSITFSGFVNPQYTKLYLFAAELIALAVLVSFKKTRTSARSFALMSLGAILTTTYVFHLVIPNGELAYQKKVIQHQLSYAEFLTDSGREKFCKDWEMTCVSFETNAHGLALAKDAGIKYITLQDPNPETKPPFISGYTGVMVGNRFVVKNYLYRPASQKSEGALIYESKQTMRAQYLAEKNFSMLGIVATSFWILFAWLLTELHNSRVRFKLFKKGPP